MLKDATVKLYGIRPELVLGYHILSSIHVIHFCIQPTITSACETTTKHAETSLHYSGCAVDIRKHDFSIHLVNEFITDARAALGSEFDLIDEGDHYHLEFQPKHPK